MKIAKRGRSILYWLLPAFFIAFPDYVNAAYQLDRRWAYFDVYGSVYAYLFTPLRQGFLIKKNTCSQAPNWVQVDDTYNLMVFYCKTSGDAEQMRDHIESLLPDISLSRAFSSYMCTRFHVTIKDASGTWNGAPYRNTCGYFLTGGESLMIPHPYGAYQQYVNYRFLFTYLYVGPRTSSFNFNFLFGNGMKTCITNCKSDLSAKKTVIQQEGASLFSGLTNSSAALPCYPYLCLTGMESQLQPVSNAFLLIGSLSAGFIVFRKKPKKGRDRHV